MAGRREPSKVRRKAVVDKLKGISMKLVPLIGDILFGAKLARAT